MKSLGPPTRAPVPSRPLVSSPSRPPALVPPVEEIPNEHMSQELREVMNRITFYDFVGLGDKTATQFFQEHNESHPYIIRNNIGLYTDAALGWPAPSSSSKEYIECNDNTPLRWQGFSYHTYIKPNARIFIKITIPGGG